MKKTESTASKKIISAVRKQQLEAGRPVKEVAREMEVQGRPCTTGRRSSGGWKSAMRHKALEEENRRLVK